MVVTSWEWVLIGWSDKMEEKGRVKWGIREVKKRGLTLILSEGGTWLVDLGMFLLKSRATFH